MQVIKIDDSVTKYLSSDQKERKHTIVGNYRAGRDKDYHGIEQDDDKSLSGHVFDGFGEEKKIG